MKRATLILALLLLPYLTGCTNDANAKPTRAADAAQTQAAKVARGKYLVGFGGCNDCHTPLKMGPNGPEPDMTRMLSGHPAELVMPEPPKPNGPWLWSGAGTSTAFAGPWGISYAKNLTPDQVSGLGIWTEEMFVKTMRTGRHMGVSRPILPPMPWQSLNSLNDEDLKAIFAYLRSIKPIHNEVPDAVIAPPPSTHSHS
ncbi:MAG TPA: c-type cytochrome [Thermoanaerobaculia bacterium]|nr:c-type cytochrome [Thermoanaerobaculia bacterium]